MTEQAGVLQRDFSTPVRVNRSRRWASREMFPTSRLHGDAYRAQEEVSSFESSPGEAGTGSGTAHKGQQQGLEMLVVVGCCRDQLGRCPPCLGVGVFGEVLGGSLFPLGPGLVPCFGSDLNTSSDGQKMSLVLRGIWIGNLLGRGYN